MKNKNSTTTTKLNPLQFLHW